MTLSGLSLTIIHGQQRDAVIRDLIKRSQVKDKIRCFMQENMGNIAPGIDLLIYRRKVFLFADADDSFIPTTLEYLNCKLLNEIVAKCGS